MLACECRCVQVERCDRIRKVRGKHLLFRLFIRIQVGKKIKVMHFYHATNKFFREITDKLEIVFRVHKCIFPPRVLVPTCSMFRVYGYSYQLSCSLIVGPGWDCHEMDIYGGVLTLTSLFPISSSSSVRSAPEMMRLMQGAQDDHPRRRGIC